MEQNSIDRPRGFILDRWECNARTDCPGYLLTLTTTFGTVEEAEVGEATYHVICSEHESHKFPATFDGFDPDGHLKFKVVGTGITEDGV